MDDGSSTKLGPSPTPPEDLPEPELVDGGVLNNGREHAWVLSCGNVIAVSEKLLEQSKDDVMKSLTRLAQRHLWLHTQEGQPQRCYVAGTQWVNGDTVVEIK